MCLLHCVLTLFSGGLVGGGEPILAMPLMLYVVGVHDPHVAVRTSLIAVTAFGLTTAFNYALFGLVDWVLAGLSIIGGVAVGLAGTRGAWRLAATKGNSKPCSRRWSAWSQPTYSRAA